MADILITGGFGFLGSHLVEELIRDPQNSVHVVDNLSTSPLNLDKFLSEVGAPANLTYSICSVGAFFTARPVPRAFDQVYHLASVVGPAGVLPHAGRMIQYIVTDTYHVLDYALATGARLVDVSTSEVYGGGQDGYCVETYPKIIPAETTIRMEYGIGKLAAETAIINTCRTTSLQACIVRPFNVAGPRQSGKGGFVLPRFIAQALANEPLSVFADGRQRRAFTHVKDMADGLIRTMEHGESGMAYNIGNPDNKVTILELARRVVHLTGSRSEIRFVDPTTIFGHFYAEANDKYPDANLAMRDLKWTPRYGIDQIIEDSVAEFLATNPGARRP